MELGKTVSGSSSFRFNRDSTRLCSDGAARWPGGARGGWTGAAGSAECAPSSRGRAAAAKTPVRQRSGPVRENRPAMRQLKLAPVIWASASARSRAAPALAGPRRGGVTDGLGCGAHSTKPPAAIQRSAGSGAGGPHGIVWLNTTLGTSRARSPGLIEARPPTGAGRYLASFAWRYNRRYQLETMIPRFVHSAARTGRPIASSLPDDFPG